MRTIYQHFSDDDRVYSMPLEWLPWKNLNPGDIGEFMNKPYMVNRINIDKNDDVNIYFELIETESEHDI